MTGSAPHFFLAKTAVRWNRGIWPRRDVARNVSTAFVFGPSHSNCVGCALSFIKGGEQESLPWGAVVESVAWRHG